MLPMHTKITLTPDTRSDGDRGWSLQQGGAPFERQRVVDLQKSMYEGCHTIETAVLSEIHRIESIIVRSPCPASTVPVSAGLIDRERATYAENHPKSRAAFEAAQQSLFGGVPMTWMTKWSGGFPLYLDSAHGNRISDIDGHTYVDFALGDTGAMAGHSPDATVRAINDRIGPQGGFTTMLPSEDAAWVGGELARRFGLPLWSFSLTATDANRWALRLARLATGKDKVLAFSYCYHGSVDETVVVLGPGGETLPRPGNVGPAGPPARDHQGRGVQRPGVGRASARAR